MGSGKGNKKRVKNKTSVLGLELINVTDYLINENVHHGHPLVSTIIEKHEEEADNYHGSYGVIDNVKLEPHNQSELFKVISSYNDPRKNIDQPFKKELDVNMELRFAIFVGCEQIREKLRYITKSASVHYNISQDYYEEILTDGATIPTETAELLAKVVDNEISNIKNDYNKNGLKKSAINYVKINNKDFMGNINDTLLDKVTNSSQVSIKKIDTKLIDEEETPVRANYILNNINKLFEAADKKTKAEYLGLNQLDSKRILEMPCALVEEYTDKNGKNRYRTLGNNKEFYYYKSLSSKYNNKKELPVLILS